MAEIKPFKSGESYTIRQKPPYTPSPLIAAFVASGNLVKPKPKIDWKAALYCGKESEPKKQLKLSKISLGKTLLSYLDRLSAKGLEFKDGVWLCGGAIRRAVNGAPIEDGDFDVYVHEPKWSDIKVMLVSKGPEHWEIAKAADKPGFETWNCQTDNLKVQFHVVKHATLADVLQNFDFTCCQMGYDGKDAWEAPNAVADARDMKLNYTGTAGYYTVARSFRFIEMGFKPTKPFLKAMQDLASRPVHEHLGIPKGESGRS